MGANLSYPAVSLSGKVALVTGANTGIGYETAKAFAGMGAHTFITCRSREKADRCVDRMKAELAEEREGAEVKVEGLELELGSFRSTRDCADAFKAKNLPLHLLVNNAGVLTQQLSKTDDNHESMYQVNHLSPFLLTLELLPKLLETVGEGGRGDCRVVLVASVAHEGGHWDPANLDAEVSYNSQTFYRNSKLYNVMTSFSLQRRLKDTGITVSSLHPGVIKSELWRNMAESSNFAFKLFAKIGPYFMRGVKDGAATTINCAVNPQLNSGQCFYYSDCAPKQPIAIARNEEYQEELWDISIKAVQQYLSPEVLEKYGASQAPTIITTAANGSSQLPSSGTPAAVAGEGEGEETQQDTGVRKERGEEKEEEGEETQPDNTGAQEGKGEEEGEGTQETTSPDPSQPSTADDSQK